MFEIISLQAYIETNTMNKDSRYRLLKLARESGNKVRSSHNTNPTEYSVTFLQHFAMHLKTVLECAVWCSAAACDADGN